MRATRENHWNWKGGAWAGDRRAVAIRQRQERLKRERAHQTKKCRTCGQPFTGNKIFHDCPICRSVETKCLGCSATITLKRKDYRDGRGKYCSVGCANAHLPHRSGPQHPMWRGGHSINKLEYLRARRKANPELFRMYKNRRRVKLKGASGSHTVEQWQHLKAAFNFTCPACQRKEPDIRLTRDHKIPLHLGGTDEISNIQPLCISCNSKKRLRLITYPFVL